MESRPQAPILPTPPQEPSSEPARRGAGAWTVISTAGSVLVGSLIVLLMGSISFPGAEAFHPVPITSSGDCLLLVLAAFLALTAHEMGHLLAAVCCRFEVLTVSLGAFRFTRAQSGWRVAAKRQRLFTGSVTAIPRSNESWRERMLVVIGAGPAASFGGVVVAGCALHLLPISGPLVSVFLRAFVQISLVILVLGLIPNSPKSQAQNDAALFLALWRDGRESNAIFLYHLVLQHQRTGLEPREFPLWLIELMASFGGRPEFMVLYAGMIASWAFDREDHASGDLWDNRALQLSARANAATQQACLANSACFDLVFRKDVAAAQRKLAQVNMDSLSSPSLQHRALATRDLAFGRIAKSLAETSAARSFLPTHLQNCGYEWSLLKRLHSAALSTL